MKKHKGDARMEDGEPTAPGGECGDEGEGVVLPSSQEAEKLMKELMQALAQKSKEAAEANEKYLRTYADFDNYRKRQQRDLADFRLYANEQLALELLPVIDHLGLALKHAGVAEENVQGLQQGVELVYKQLRDVLEKFGIKSFESWGEPFDPAKHDAMMQVERDDVPANMVVQVMNEGYLYHDKVLRHAKVGVSKRPAEETQEPVIEEQPATE
jgi:molecular chaperone GrpE